MGGVNSTVAAANSTTAAMASCTSLCSSLTFPNEIDAVPISCQSYAADDNITITGGQATAKCGSVVQPEVDICRVTISVQTSDNSHTYMEVWLPDGNSSAWNGRTMSTDNGGLNGCVHYVDMKYVSGLGFATIGDNGGHNSSAFDGSWMTNNDAILDWAYRGRHQSVVAGKAVVNQFYGTPANYSYYLGCSTGGQQGFHSAQYYPSDFDGIIAGSAAADFNHLQDWSSRFVQLTNDSSDSFLTLNDWITVEAAILDQCDEKLDGVPDGILEDPTLCDFDSSVLACSNNSTLNACLTDTQVTTVNKVFTSLFDTNGRLLYPALLYGSQVDAYRLGQLSGSIQGIAADWFKYGVYNDSSFNVLDVGQTDYAKADSQDVFHGNVSSFNGDLSAFRSAGGKMLVYHGMADPLVAGSNSQRYYLKVANTMSLNYTAIDPFMRLFRISGMAHCGVGGISGAGAWMLGQNAAASAGRGNVVSDMVDWVENGNAPETLLGSKFWYDLPSLGLKFERPHCRFPYRTTYEGGDWNTTTAWGCRYIEDWEDCGAGARPRLCSANGSF